MRVLRRALREAAALVRRAAGGTWRYYANPSAANTPTEAFAALRARTLGAGPAVAEYERRFAETVETQHAFSFAAGRMALYALLEALEVGPGDEVVLPAFTCVVVPNAILYRGATPVYVDIDARTYNVDAALVGERITPRTKAILAQHTFGLACDVPALRTHGVPVIEDGAHALGARLDGRPVGSLADAAFFSTDHTKVIGTGTGGMVTTSDAGLAARVAEVHARAPFVPDERARRALRVLAAETLLLQPALAPAGRVLLDGWLRPGAPTPFFLDELRTEKPAAYPYPARLGDAQARIGLSQLGQLEANLAHRRATARAYDAVLHRYDDVPDEQHAFVRYVFGGDRAEWERRLGDVVDMTPWFTSVVHGRDEQLEAVGYAPRSCPIAERAAATCVNLPTHPRLRDARVVTSRL